MYIHVFFDSSDHFNILQYGIICCGYIILITNAVQYSVESMNCTHSYAMHDIKSIIAHLKLLVVYALRLENLNCIFYITGSMLRDHPLTPG